MEKEKTLSEIRDNYLSLSYQAKVIILDNALSYMEQSNTRGRLDCIALGMGYKYNHVTDKWSKNEY